MSLVRKIKRLHYENFRRIFQARRKSHLQRRHHLFLWRNIVYYLRKRKFICSNTLAYCRRMNDKGERHHEGRQSVENEWIDWVITVIWDCFPLWSATFGGVWLQLNGFGRVGPGTIGFFGHTSPT